MMNRLIWWAKDFILLDDFFQCDNGACLHLFDVPGHVRRAWPHFGASDARVETGTRPLGATCPLERNRPSLGRARGLRSDAARPPSLSRGGLQEWPSRSFRRSEVSPVFFLKSNASRIDVVVVSPQAPEINSKKCLRTWCEARTFIDGLPEVRSFAVLVECNTVKPYVVVWLFLVVA